MKRAQHVALVISWWCMTGAAVGHAQAPASGNNAQADRFAGVRAEIQRQLTTTNVASIAVAVAKDGKIIWEEGFGWADREAMRPATANTMYSLASISKTFTATGLMTLVEQGKVDLNRPANDYLGLGKLTGLAGDANEATVRRVLSHTAGLPLHYQFFYTDQSYEPPSMDETIARYGNLVFAPGTVYEYSNLGFGIIDHIIERVSGESYSDYMRTHVFLPLGLTHTSVDIAPGLEPYAAQRYDDRQRPIPFYSFDHRGASAVYSSAHDLVRFAMFHLKDHVKDQRAILADTTIDRMHVAVPPAPAYGLGFAIGTDMGLLRVSHNGGMPGVSTTMNLYPTENLVVVVLTGTGGQLNPVAQELVAAMVPKYADSLRARRAQQPAGGRGAGAGGRGGQQPSQLSDLTGEWSGTLRTWQGTVPFRLTVAADGNVFAALGPTPGGQRGAGAAPQRQLVNQAAFRNNRLSGQFMGRVQADDVARWPYTLQLGLLLVDGVLKGQVTAVTSGDVTYYGLSSYAELKKQ